MIEMEPIAANRLGRATVLATILCPYLDSVSELIGGRHFEL